ncbi:ABC transporter permease [Falsiruegeria mediterranea]|jgi:spermidine/putrescine transport system permease protein|uniref:Spermidine/putrescine transport system permease protein PotC n=1 Tax=Falsiruegeria mediterranea M17 TaxID=1200281 RepID=A0A2R8CDE8_9RHOB|nr:Inner membrane ABC transporter permease protein YdcV [Falsiruegeria mediterranea M17]
MDKLLSIFRPSTGSRELRRQPLFTGMSWLVLLFLYAPIAVLVVFSFNDNRSVVRWTEFSLRWYAAALENDDIRRSAMISIQVAFTATVFSTIIATMAALATTRGGVYRGRSAAIALINQPLMIPEIVTAIATLAFFSILRQLTGVTGIGWLILAHTVFCVPFAYMPIRARLSDMSVTYEAAAADLYATPWQTFRHVTLPLLMPGVMAGAMLAFVVSLDDVIITLLVAGPGETTLPIYILGQIRRGVTPEVNAISTILIGLTVAMVTLTFFLQRKRK